MTNTDKGESVSDTECPLPKRSQLRAARPHDADDQQENPTTSAIPMTDEASAPTPDPAKDREEAEEAPALSVGERRRNVHPVGYVHLKDVLYATGEEREQPITPWRIRRLEAVSADDQVEDALRHMQRTGVHCALVREAGTVVGILFLEDILELLVGEVRDVLQRP